MTDKKVTFASTNSYSQALYELGNESGSLNEIEDQANNILKLISVNAELKNFIKNPTIESGCYNAGFENIRIIDIAKMVQEKISSKRK